MVHLRAGRVAALLILILSAFALPHVAEASHFRGGLITWQPADIDGDGEVDDVKITVKTAWGSFHDIIGFAVTPAFPSGYSQVGSEEFTYVNGTSITNAEYTLKVTQLQALNLDPNTSYLVRFTGSARISNLRNNADGSWNIQTIINLSGGNKAPQIEMPIILDVPRKNSDGTTLTDWTFDLNSTDPNADAVRYRMADSGEMGGGTNPTGLSIDPVTGLITWAGSGTATVGLYSAGFVVEDLENDGVTVRSKTHVDLILNLVDDSASDYTVDPRVPKTRNVVVPKGEVFEFDITGAAIDTTSLGSLQGTLTEPTDNHFRFEPGDIGSGLDPGTYPVTFDVQEGGKASSYLTINFIVPDPDAPAVANLEGDQAFFDLGAPGPVRIDVGQDAVLSDPPDNDVLTGGYIKLNLAAAAAEEVLAIANEGTGPGQIGVTGSTVTYGGLAIGTIDDDENGEGTALRIDFDTPDATLAAVQALLRALTYDNTAGSPASGERAMALYLEDADGKSNAVNLSVLLDSDADGDGIAGSVEGTGDDDGDGLPNDGDLDSDNDRVPDAKEGTADSDFDGDADYRDTDSDDDGLADAVEGGASGTDTDADGIDDAFDVDATGGTDADGDGIDDAPLRDSDGDGLADLRDADSDGDGAPDGDEGAGDSDGDGTPDYRDRDSDGDGIDDRTEAGRPAPRGTDGDGDGIDDAWDVDATGGDDANGNGIDDLYDGRDSDGDGIDDARDEDSDNDGVSDAVEAAEGSDPTDPASRPADADLDGLPDVLDPNDANPDIDGDGIPDGADVDVDGDGTADNGTDGDGDGIRDAVDADDVGDGDADGDGIGDTADVVDDRADADGDGLPDAFDPNDGNPDIDGDGIPDGADVDVDGDGTADNGADGDGDGINDVADADRHPPGSDLDGDNVIDRFDLDVDGDGIDNWTEGTSDADGDGKPDYLDASVDEDRDGIPDIIEGNFDSDGDGKADFEDVDSDGDGVLDRLEYAGLDVDADGDGIPDLFDVDATGGRDDDGDGIDDDVRLPDADFDNLPDHLDADGDGDGLPDAIEAGAAGADEDGDGIDDAWDADTTGGPDLDGDGIDDGLRLRDTDHDGVPDVRDEDSDGDGVSDRAESGASGADADGDGIDDAWDVDYTGGPDVNGDGVDDAAIGRDTDGDGVADYRDLDSDGDGLFDVVEGAGFVGDEDGLAEPGTPPTHFPRDLDGDGVPDYLDLDSNGDGVYDIESTAYALLDADGDGRIDGLGDSDGDGIDDIVDQEPGQHGSRRDADGDGVPSELDGDDDNDGIPDAVEGDEDSDGDGTPDRLDRDADGDGLPDRLESRRPALLGLDVDLDGIDDAVDATVTGGPDADGDGIDDRYADADSDGDGIPDRLDADSDNDGLSDADEMLLVALSGGDADGDGIDDAIDVDQTGGVDADGDGVDDALLRTQDLDGDGLPDYRDPDSDGDGIVDGDEDGDFNADGIDDRHQKDPGLRASLEGGGGGSTSVPALLALALAVLLRTRRRVTALPLAALAAALLAGLSPARGQAETPACEPGGRVADGCLYAGFALGRSGLDPDDSRSTWRVADDSDTSYKLTIGYRFTERWFAELSYSDLGGAGLQSRNPAIRGEEALDYEVPALFGGYLFRLADGKLDAYVKAGYASLRTSASSARVDHEDVHGNQLALGAGLRWHVSSRLAVGVGVDGFDEDARFIGVGLTTGFGRIGKR
ncbi:MAG TPA: putative Ig domain-containing protein [Gammaproteobacteria bacterium]